MLRVFFNLLFIGLMAQSCVQSKAKEIQVVTADEVNAHKKYILDDKDEILSKDDFKKSQLVNAESLLTNENSRKALYKLEKDAPIAVYFTSDNRSDEAAKLLHKLGFQQIYILDGGIEKWHLKEDLSV